MTNEKPKKKERRAKRRPMSDFPPHEIGTFMDEPNGWDFVMGHGVAERELGSDSKPLPLSSGVMGLGGRALPGI